MIVIRRRPGETLHLGPEIQITVLSLSPSRVKLGIEAPGSVSVLRGEMKQAAEQNREAAQQELPASLGHLAQSLRLLDQQRG